MSSEINVLIADDHALIRNGLKQVITKQTSFNVHEAVDGKQALNHLLNNKIDVAILDIDMPFLTGIEIAERVQSEEMSTDIIFLTMHKDEQLFNKAMNLGVKGFVLKDNTVTEIVSCLNTVINGNHYLSPVLSNYLLRRNSISTIKKKETNKFERLTFTEKKVLQELGTMKTNSEIAEILGVSIKTVQNHRNNICRKLGISGTHALLKFAVENKSNLH